MRKAEIVASVIFLLISALVIYEALRLGVGWGLEGPQPGFFIFWLGLGLGICCVIGVIQVLVDRAIFMGKDFVSRRSLPEVLKVFLPMAGAILLMEFLGFYIASALYLGLFMRWVGRFSWGMVLLVAFFFAFSHYLIFEKWFLVPLPKGLLEPYIGL
ncbi:MAG: tripartite tricarboxylate transporter TctB family protein [Deltaproteobacteria bacterium]|nr:tripartite tricarboxylate transporter TctB family protein [Deltaproteobacteria bacterium]